MKKQIKTLLLLLAVCLGAGSTVSAQQADRILGVYRVIGEETKEVSKVKVYKSGDTYEAKIIWLEHPLDEKGKPRLDKLNPNPALRSVRGDAIVIVKGLRYDQKRDIWTGGTIYNPVTGKIYDANAQFDTPKALRVRGFLGKPMLGKSFDWIKLE